mmetsp:Transcript_46467/g.56291  ORF Transcript_46467/g.56291 Transcript_46467/m.56291 type:complete len:131 (+) Transcript_46467:231-623(+)
MEEDMFASATAVVTEMVATSKGRTVCLICGELLPSLDDPNMSVSSIQGSYDVLQGDPDPETVNMGESFRDGRLDLEVEVEESLKIFDDQISKLDQDDLKDDKQSNLDKAPFLSEAAICSIVKICMKSYLK